VSDRHAGGYRGGRGNRAARRAFFRDTCYVSVESQQAAARFRGTLVAKYGPERGGNVKYAEVFEISEYAAGLDPERTKALFPF
jgi:hypothetical protein